MFKKCVKVFEDTISLAYYVVPCLVNNHPNRELVVTYHSINDIPKKDDPYKMNVAVSLFKKHLDFLNHHNKQNIILTFDDGFANFFHIALPLILKYNMRIIIFIVVNFIDGKMTFDNFFKTKFKINPLTWKQLREIAGLGIEIGSHTLTHHSLSELDSQTACLEITDSKKRIEDIIGKKVKYFAYPFGSRSTFNRQIKMIVEESGYEKAYTNIMGFNEPDTDFFELRRIRIYNDDSMLRFRLKVAGAYNWVDKC